MKAFFLPLLFIGLGLAQTTNQVEAPSTRGHITVFVHWEGQGLPDHRVDLLETGTSRTTSESGIVRFSVRPGDYTVRVYDLNRGGPPLQFIDFPVSVEPGETVRVDALDCLPCV